MNSDDHVLRWRAAMAIINGDGKCSRHGLTGGQEVQVGFTDRVGPVDRAVIGVAAAHTIRRNRECCFNRRFLRVRQRQHINATGLGGRHSIGHFARRGTVGQIHIREGDQTGVAQRCTFSDSTGHIGRCDHRYIVGTVNSDGHVLRRDTGMGVINRDDEDRSHGLTGCQEVQVTFRYGVAPVYRSVIGVASIGTNREGCFNSGFLGVRQRQRTTATSFGGCH